MTLALERRAKIVYPVITRCLDAVSAAGTTALQAQGTTMTHKCKPHHLLARWNAYLLFIASLTAPVAATATSNALHPDVEALKAMTAESRSYYSVINQIRPIVEKRFAQQRQWLDDMESNDTNKKVSAYIRYACAMLHHSTRAKTECPSVGPQAPVHAVDEHRARTLFAEAMEYLEERKKKQGSFYKSYQKSQCRYVATPYCQWSPKTFKTTIKLIDRLEDRSARLAAAQACIATQCTDGEFSSTRADLARHLFNQGVALEAAPEVRRSLPQAMAWYDLAAQQGHAGAAYLLAVIHASGYLGTWDMDAAQIYAIHANTLALQMKTDQQIALGFGRPQDYSRTRVALSQNTFASSAVKIENVSDYHEFVRYTTTGAEFIAQMNKHEQLYKQNALSAEDLNAISENMAGLSGADGKPLDAVANLWAVRAADSGHRAAAQRAYTYHATRKTGDPQEWRSHYDLAERLGEKLVKWNFSADHVIRDRVARNHRYGSERLETSPDDARAFFERRLYWTNQAVARKDSTEMRWLARQLWHGPDAGYAGLITVNKPQGLALAEQVAAMQQERKFGLSEDMEDIILAERAPERIPEVMEQRRKRAEHQARLREEEERKKREKAAAELAARLEREKEEERKREEERLRNLPPTGTQYRYYYGSDMNRGSCEGMGGSYNGFGQCWSQ